MSSAYCSNCGAQNLGTRFCENCGQALQDPALAAIPTYAGTAPPMPSAVVVATEASTHQSVSATGGSKGSPFNILAFIAYLAYLVVPGVATIALFSAYIPGMDGWYTTIGWVSIILLVCVGLFLAIAGFTSRTSSGRSAAAGLLSIGAGGLAVLPPLISILLGNSYYAYGWVGTIGTYLMPLLLFLSWAIARPFRGPGYFALLIGVGVVALYWLVLAMGLGGWYLISSILALLMGVVMVVASVGSAIGFEKGASARAAQIPVAKWSHPTGAGLLPGPQGAYGPPVYAGYPVYGPAHTNGLAVASMIFGIVGGSVIAIILGHVAKSQIRRTGEAGGGMATAGLVLGYFWLVVGLVLTIVYVAQFARLLGGLGGY